MDYLTTLYLLPKLPMLAVSLAGFGIGIKYWPHHPRVSRLVVLGTAIHLFAHLVDPILIRQLPVFGMEHGLGPEAIGWLAYAKTAALTTLDALAWGLVLLAAFRWRGVGAVPTAGPGHPAAS